MSDLSWALRVWGGTKSHNFTSHRLFRCQQTTGLSFSVIRAVEGNSRGCGPCLSTRNQTNRHGTNSPTFPRLSNRIIQRPYPVQITCFISWIATEGNYTFSSFFSPPYEPCGKLFCLNNLSHMFLLSGRCFIESIRAHYPLLTRGLRRDCQVFEWKLEFTCRSACFAFDKNTGIWLFCAYESVAASSWEIVGHSLHWKSRNGRTGCKNSSRPPAISACAAFHVDSYLPYNKRWLCKRNYDLELLEIMMEEEECVRINQGYTVRYRREMEREE
jgi:hypothetical protein